MEAGLRCRHVCPADGFVVLFALIGSGRITATSGPIRLWCNVMEENVIGAGIAALSGRVPPLGLFLSCFSEDSRG